MATETNNAHTGLLPNTHVEQQESLSVERYRLETMMREANHRIANSLALAAAMVELQIRRLDGQNAHDALIDTRGRLEAVGQLHRLLAREGGHAAVEMEQYLSAIVSRLQQIWTFEQGTRGARSLRLQCDQIAMPPQQALALVVIANELVTNACKYAYPDGCAGAVDISLQRQANERFELTVSDDGIGKPSVAWEQSEPGHGLGSTFVDRLVASMHATMVERSSSLGTTIVVAGACLKI